MIYLDNQATTPLDPDVIQAMCPYSKGELFANPHSTSYILGIQSAETVEEHRTQVAEYLSALPSEIIFTSGATESNNIAIIGTAIKAQEKNINRYKVLVSSTDHKCVLGAVRFVEQHFGMQAIYVPNLRCGTVDIDFIKQHINDQALQVCVMGTNNEIGTNQPIQEIGVLCAEHGVNFHVDMAQSAYTNIDPVDYNITTMSISSHKIYGPKGIGCLYINSFDAPITPSPIMYGGGQENNIRPGTLPTPLIVGFGTATKKMAAVRKTEPAKLQELQNLFITELQKTNIPFNINGTMKTRHPGNINIEFIGINATTLLTKIGQQICASTGSACTSGIQEPSHVLKAINLTTQQCDSSIRFSIGRFTTKQNIFEGIQIIKMNILR